jgi:plastocyanin
MTMSGFSVVAAPAPGGVGARSRSVMSPACRPLRQAVDVALASLLLIVAAPLCAAEISGRVVNAQGEPVSEAVVFVDQLPAGNPPPAAGTAVLDQVNKEFVPHILPVAVGTLVSFPNHDQIHHHVYSLSRTKTFEIPLYKGETAAPIRFDQVGAVKVGCNIHDWMSGVILVVPTSYFATTDEQGAFVLHDLPAGAYSVVAWHEGSKVKVDDTRQTLTASDAPTPVTFALDVAERRARPAARRSFE